MRKFCLKVVSNEAIADRVFRMTAEGECERPQPGQFVHIKCGDATLLRRPISICDAVTLAHGRQRMTLIYRLEGAGTEWMSRQTAGQLIDCLGPLGHGFPVTMVKPGARVLLVGGGVGVPPLYQTAKEVVARGAKLVIVIGFNSAKDVFYANEFAKLGETYVSTMDGTSGVHGMVTDVLDGLDVPDREWDVYFACGPFPMLKALQARFKGTGVKGYLSMEQRMGCGVGACLACVIPLQGRASDAKAYAKICCDGPVFDAWEVVL
jgi:dihydroorotate dehydrogenase electron transfer subunit